MHIRVSFRCFFAVLMCVTYAVTAAAHAQAPADAEAQRGQVGRFLQQLNAATVAQRDAAEAALLEMGAEILPLLPAETQLKAGPAEVALRVGRVRLELERQKSLDTLEPAAVLVSEMPQEAMTVEAWCRLLEEKTRNPMRLALPPGAEGLAKKEITFAFSAEAPRVPFWPLVDEICRQGNLAPQFREMQPAVFLVPESGTPRNVRAIYAGPFRVEPKKVTATVLLDRDVRATQVQTEIAWEPRLAPVFLDVQLTRLMAETHELPLAPRVQQVPVGRGTVATTFEIPLTLKDAAENAFLSQATTFTLHGKLTAVVAGPKHPFTFTTLDRKIDRNFPPESQRVAAVLVTLTNLRREVRKSAENPDEIVKEIVATVRYRYEKTHGAMESHRTWVYENSAWLETPDGQKIASTDYEMLRQTTNEISLDLYFPDTGQKLTGWKLVYPRPTGIYAVEYEFEMINVPAP